MRHKSFAIAWFLAVGCALGGSALFAAESPGCDKIRQYWTDLQAGGSLAGTVEESDVPGSVPGAIDLDTASFFLYVPAVQIKWPITPMKVDLSTPSAPTVLCDGSSLTVTTQVQLAFSVLLYHGPVLAFVISVPFSYDPALRFDPNHPFRWTIGSLPPSIVASFVGPIDLSLLQGLNLRPYLGLAHP